MSNLLFVHFISKYSNQLPLRISCVEAGHDRFPKPEKSPGSHQIL